jgi:hypothetical protein
MGQYKFVRLNEQRVQDVLAFSFPQAVFHL